MQPQVLFHSRFTGKNNFLVAYDKGHSVDERSRNIQISLIDQI